MSHNFVTPANNPKTVCIEGQADRIYFCSCRNTCTRGSGPKKAGCPCRDQELLCTNQCTCGKPNDLCRNRASTTNTTNVSKVPHTDPEKATNTCYMDRDSSSSSDVDGKITKLTSLFNDSMKIRSRESGSTARARRNNSVHVQSTNVHQTTEEASATYKISKGYALIIHNKNFKSLRYRAGSDKDMESIKDFCKSACITIHKTLEDLAATEIEELSSEVSRKNFHGYDAFLCFILSHGEDGVICGVDGNKVEVERIVSGFRENPTLVGKPKLFFIQACRGRKSDSGRRVEADSIEFQETPVQEQAAVVLPENSDILIAHSTYSGYESYRFSDTGSLFIMKLIEQLKQHAHAKHLMDILTLVNSDVSKCDIKVENTVKKQISCQMTSLSKFVYFNVPPPKSYDY